MGTAAAKIIAIEKDTRCLPVLQQIQTIDPHRLEIIHGDALAINLASLCPPPRAIIANLPYNVATPLLISWLSHGADFQSMTLMFQAEVADRIVALPDTKAYGRLAVISQYTAVARRVMALPARAFTPPPKVDSAVVHLVPRQGLFTDFSFDDLEQVTAAAFGQRRKMLRSAMKSLGGEALLVKAGIDPNRRAETLTVEEFAALAAALRQQARQ